MAISNYGELKTAVATWLNRSELASYVADFIKLAEQRIYYGGSDPFQSDPLRVPAMQQTTTGTVTGNAFPYPSDLLEIQRVSVSVNGYYNELLYVSQQQLAEKRNNTDTPRVYTFNADEIQVAGTGAADYQIDYIAKFTALSDPNDTNWLLTNAPGVYLYGALMESAMFVYDDERAGRWHGMFRGLVNGLNAAIPKPVDGSIRVMAK